jgi:hypothetical protein
MLNRWSGSQNDAASGIMGTAVGTSVQGNSMYAKKSKAYQWKPSFRLV